MTSNMVALAVIAAFSSASSPIAFAEAKTDSSEYTCPEGTLSLDFRGAGVESVIPLLADLLPDQSVSVVVDYVTQVMQSDVHMTGFNSVNGLNPGEITEHTGAGGALVSYWWDYLALKALKDREQDVEALATAILQEHIGFADDICETYRYTKTDDASERECERFPRSTIGSSSILLLLHDILGLTAPIADIDLESLRVAALDNLMGNLVEVDSTTAVYEDVSESEGSGEYSSSVVAAVAALSFVEEKETAIAVFKHYIQNSMIKDLDSERQHDRGMLIPVSFVDREHTDVETFTDTSFGALPMLAFASNYVADSLTDEDKTIVLDAIEANYIWWKTNRGINSTKDDYTAIVGFGGNIHDYNDSPNDDLRMYNYTVGYTSEQELCQTEGEALWTAEDFEPFVSPDPFYSKYFEKSYKASSGDEWAFFPLVEDDCYSAFFSYPELSAGRESGRFGSPSFGYVSKESREATRPSSFDDAAFARNWANWTYPILDYATVGFGSKFSDRGVRVGYHVDIVSIDGLAWMAMTVRHLLDNNRSGLELHNYGIDIAHLDQFMRNCAVGESGMPYDVMLNSTWSYTYGNNPLWVLLGLCGLVMVVVLVRVLILKKKNRVA